MHLDCSEKELKRAKVALNKMKEINIEDEEEIVFEIENYWIDFLNILEKVWKKSERECRHFSTFQPWQGKFIRERKRDPLLKYLKHARDIDQHDIQIISSKQGYKADIVSPKNGFKYRPGDIISIKATLTPPRIEVEDFICSGVLYPIPKKHLGQKIKNPKNPIELAELGYKYYEEYLNRIKAKFLK